MNKKYFLIFLALSVNMMIFSNSYDQLKFYLHTFEGSIHFYYEEFSDSSSFSENVEYIICNKGTDSIWIYGKSKNEYINIVKNSLITPKLYQWMENLGILDKKMSYVDKKKLYIQMINLIFNEKNIDSVEDFQDLKELNFKRDSNSKIEYESIFFKDYDESDDSIQNNEITFKPYKGNDVPEIITKRSLEESNLQNKFILYSYTAGLERIIIRREFVLNKKGAYSLKSEDEYWYGFLKPEFVHFEDKVYNSN